MKVNLKQVIKDYSGKDTANDRGEPVTYRDAIWVALNNYQPGEDPTPEDKLIAYKISSKIFESDPDFTIEEAAFIKERSGRVSPPLLYGRISELFDKVDK